MNYSELNGPVHTFAGNPLDRGELVRRDEDQLAALARHPQAQYLPFNALKVAVNAAGGLNWRSPSQVSNPNSAVFLGLLEDRPHFAVEVDASDLEFSDCRLVASNLSAAETGILAQARAQLDWHSRNPFCAQCGNATESRRGGQIRYCDRCDSHIFPRTDPVAIMLIIDAPGGDRALLGQSQGRMAKSQFYSALAGFLDQGESLEEAVRREVKEEAGINVGAVRYHSSQPWPFPSQLMIGCHGVATTQDITIHPTEMADVRWFLRDELAHALSQEHGDLRVPGPAAIAHHLIRSWVSGEVSL